VRIDVMETSPLNARDTAVHACLCAASRPLSAYDLLDGRRAVEPRIAPTAIYRSLSKLERAGLVQRVATLNAWIARPAKLPHAPSVLAICDSCGAVEQVAEPSAIQAVTDAVTRSGFHPNRPVIEVHGHCTRCEPETDPIRSAPR
jgi:Fur family zinc uptake transcriptional regulator